MKLSRETAAAIIIGFVLGFGLAAGIFFLPGIRNRTQISDIPEVMRSGKSPPTPSESLLTIKEPPDKSTTAKSEITVSGTTKPGTLIVVSTTQGDLVTTVKTDGTFETSIAIGQGPGDLWISSYVDGVVETTQKRIVYVVPEEQTTNEP